MAAINPWASWGVLTDQSWGISAVDPWASWGESRPLAVGFYVLASPSTLLPRPGIRVGGLEPGWDARDSGPDLSLCRAGTGKDQ
uniref:Zinc finger protein 606 n=1 Tax=Neovison vison TaxID=452646 RepID=A0A8C7ER40_NEOVI